MKRAPKVSSANGSTRPAEFRGRALERPSLRRRARRGPESLKITSRDSREFFRRVRLTRNRDPSGGAARALLSREFPRSSARRVERRRGAAVRGAVARAETGRESAAPCVEHAAREARKSGAAGTRETGR